MSSRSRQQLGFGDHIIRGDLRSRAAYWRPYWRSAILRIVEKSLFGGEVNATSPFSWSFLQPLVAENIVTINNYVGAVVESFDVNVHSFAKSVTEYPHSRIETLEQVLPRRNAYHLRDVFVDTRTGGCWNAAGWILGESTGSISGGSVPLSVRESWRKRSTLKVARPVVILPIHENFFHWLIDLLPPFLNSMYEAGPDVLVLGDNRAPDWLKGHASQMGWGVKWIDDAVVHTQNYFVTGRGRSESRSLDLELLKNCFETEMGPICAEQCQGLVLSRKNHRRLDQSTNFLEAVSRDMGADVVDFGAMSIGKQRSIVQRAKWMAGATGAAFANMVWAAPGTKVILLTDVRFAGASWGHFAPLASRSGVELHCVEYVDEVAPHAFERLLERILAIN